MQAGQKLSRHIKHEMKEADLERKLAHIEQFGPILVEKLVLLAGANDARRKKAEDGLKKILGRDSEAAVNQLEEAQTKLAEQKKKEAKKMGVDLEDDTIIEDAGDDSADPDSVKKPSKKVTKKPKK